jgi:hypothetical protein
MGKRKMDGPNPSNPFVDEGGIEHLDGVVEHSWGTVSRPLRTNARAMTPAFSMRCGGCRTALTEAKKDHDDEEKST